MREKVEGLKIRRADRLWMASMRICRKYCGCHQMPERSFFAGSYQFPLCARCTGIVVGHILGIMVSYFRRVSFVCLLGTVPLMIDGTVQKFSSYRSTNRRRLWTGILYGFGMMCACIHGILIIGEWIRRQLL